jgi:hypothetical protein
MAGDQPQQVVLAGGLAASGYVVLATAGAWRAERRVTVVR